ncbi:hypothetical protein HK100_004357 [Physocladia obscura]|uniref:Cilia- and flagella-associated protein 58 central coiled coil domain-containing protein n=1 Tax=Physocladia obscura TaxID=109957 RepID=A0AAD5T742_9FUNG|nr:hypothetical protein HK100_004357 [Physocladia obscura]
MPPRQNTRSVSTNRQPSQISASPETQLLSSATTETDKNSSSSNSQEKPKADSIQSNRGDTKNNDVSENNYDNDEDDDENKETAAKILGSMVIQPVAVTPIDFGIYAVVEDKPIDMPLSGANFTISHAAETMFDETTNLIPINEDTFADIQNTMQILAAIRNDEAEGGHRGSSPSISEHNTLMIVKNEYEKLQKLFMQSRKNEQDLVKKCKDVTGQMMANSVKVQAALKLSQNDRNTIASLKKEVKRAWKMVENVGEKEQKSKEAVARLKVEVNKMRQISGFGDPDIDADDEESLAEGGGFNRMMALQLEQEATIANLNKEKEFLGKQNDQLQSSVTVLHHEISDMTTRLASAYQEKQVCEKDLAALKELLALKKTDEERSAQNRTTLEQSIKNLTESNSKREHDILSKNTEIKALKEIISRLESIVKDDKSRIEKDVSERDKLTSKLSKLQTEYDHQNIDVMRLKAENQDQFIDLKSWEDELNKYKEEYKAMARMKDGLMKRVKQVEDAKIEAEVDRDNLRGHNNSLTHERDTLKKQLEFDLKQIESLSRERDIAQKNFVRATGATQKQLNTAKLAEQTKRNLEQEISAYKEEAAKMRKIIYSLEKDRDRYINEASKISAELAIKDEDVKIKDVMLYDARKKIADFERKLKEQQSLYENVRADRNLYSKNLIESQEEINEIKRKIKIMSHQIEQLKEEIGNKEAALAKESVEHAKLGKDKEALSSQIDKLKQQVLEMEMTLQNQKAEENKLKHIISEADADRLKQKKEFEILVQERDILGTQLIRRNDEISLLYEKIKIQASTLNKGEVQYHERLEDIRVLKLEIKRLRREKAILQTETQNVDSFKNEIFKLQREILRERTRVKVLEEELESPMNIHRWRKLSGSDPSTYELITKIQTLQRRLISKTEEVLEKELIISQKEKLYREVKDVLQRQPGPEVLEELRVVKDAARTKMRECKALASELNMYHSQVNQFKFEIDRLTQELQDVKRKYYDQKKRDREERLRKTRMEAALSPGGVVSERMGALVGIFGDHTSSEASVKNGRLIQMPVIKSNPKATNNKYIGGGFKLTLLPAGIHPNAENADETNFKLPELHMSKNEGGSGQNEGGRMAANLPPPVKLKKLSRPKIPPPGFSLGATIKKSGTEIHSIPGSNKRRRRTFSKIGSNAAIDNGDEGEFENEYGEQKHQFSETQPEIEFSTSFTAQYDDRLANCELNAKMDVESLYMQGQEENEYFEANDNGGEEFDVHLKGESCETVEFDSDDETTRNEEPQQQNPEDDNSEEETEGNFYRVRIQELNGKLQEVHYNTEEEFLEEMNENSHGSSDNIPSLKLESFDQVVLINNKKYFKLTDGQDLPSELHKSLLLADIQQNIQVYAGKMAEKVQEIATELKSFYDFKMEAIALMEKGKLDARSSLEFVRMKRFGAKKLTQSLLTNGGMSELIRATNDYSSI